MKVLVFHLMPYPELPTDFCDHHASVCVDIDPRMFDAQVVAQAYEDYLGQLALAAELGIDGVCVNEHHASGYGMMPSPNLMAATLIQRCEEVAICVLGDSIALYDPPTRVAEELAMLDCLSRGRVIAGFPVGTPMDTAFASSRNPATIRARYLESLNLILRSWKEDSVFSHNGRFSSLRYVNTLPKPIQRPHPPIWIPGGGSFETWEFCVERDYAYCYVSYYGYRAAVEVMAGFWKTMKAAGKPCNPNQASFLQIVGIGETRAEALKLYAEPAEYLYRNGLHIDARFVGPPGYETEASIRRKAAPSLDAAAAPKGRLAMGGVARDWEGIVEQGYVLVGSADEVADRLREIALELGVGHLLTLLHFGNMSNELACYNTKLFVERVVPQLRDLFDDWEDPWWPKSARTSTTTNRTDMADQEEQKIDV